MKEITLVFVLIVVLYTFWMLNSNYLSVFNIRNIFSAAFVMGTLAVGMSCLLIGGRIDLSAGGTGMLAGIIIAILLRSEMNWILALIITLLFGAATGLVNAFFVNVMRFAPFIATLAVSSVYSGLSLVVTNAHNISISSQLHPTFILIGSTNIGIIPLPFLITLILMVAYGVMLSYTKFGRRVYMVGGNANAARLAGINPKQITSILFVNNSVIASLAGALIASRMHMGSPTAVMGADLDGITAAILGGIAFTGGAGNMFGVFVGLMLLTSFQNGLVVVGFGPYYQVAARGLLLVAALILDYYRVTARQKSLSTRGTHS